MIIENSEIGYFHGRKRPSVVLTLEKLRGKDVLTIANARNDSGKVLGRERLRTGAGHHLEMGLLLRWVVKSHTDVLVIAWPGGHHRPRRAAKHFTGR